MPFEGILGSPLLKKALQAGEEQVGRAVSKLLANEGVAAGVQTLISGAVQARATFERGVSQALHVANLPSRDDMDALRKKLDELEAMLDGLAEKVGRRGPGGGDGGE